MYPSDLSDEEWALLAPFFQRPDPRGNPGKYANRAIVNAMLYVTKGGIQWRMMPTDFPPWDTVYDHFRRLNKRGVWEQALDTLNACHRQGQGRTPEPSYAIIDSQSVKTQYASNERGIDGGKKVKGRKRPIATDILGNLLAVIVHAANRADTTEGIRVCMQVVDKYLSIEAFSADAGYRGTTAEWVDEWLNRRVDISDKPPQGFEILPKRWIVERTVACLGGFRRLAKDFEILTRTAENMIRIAMIKVTVAKCV